VISFLPLLSLKAGGKKIKRRKVIEEITGKTCPECGHNEAYIVSDRGIEIEYECVQCQNLFTAYFRESWSPEYDE